MAGKGSKRREEDTKQVNDNWDEINWVAPDNVEELERTLPTITIISDQRVGSYYEPGDESFVVSREISGERCCKNSE